MERKEERDHPICGEVSSMLASEGGTFEISQTPLTLINTRVEVGHVTMDFITTLPRNPKGNNAAWVVIDHLTKSAHFI